MRRDDAERLDARQNVSDLTSECRQSPGSASGTSSCLGNFQSLAPHAYVEEWLMVTLIDVIQARQYLSQKFFFHELGGSRRFFGEK